MAYFSLNVCISEAFYIRAKFLDESQKDPTENCQHLNSNDFKSDILNTDKQAHRCASCSSVSVDDNSIWHTPTVAKASEGEYWALL